MKKEKSYFSIIFILGLLTAIGPFSIDMYLPAFPAIAKGLNTSVAQVMLSLSSFFIGISAGQLIYGPLLERFGRKKPLYVGLVIYLFASAGCAFTESVNALIAFRFLQALGSCAGLVTSRAMVRDLFDVKDNAKVFSSLMLVVAVSPIIAPTVGGYVTAALGWRYVFAALMIVDFAVLAAVFFLLPESKKPDPSHSLKPMAVTKSFFKIIIHPQFYVYALTGSVAASGLYAYISGSPQVFIEFFGVNEKQYGWIFAIIAIGIISTSQINTLMLRRYASEKIIPVALMFQSVIGLTLATIAFFHASEFYSTIALIFLYISCQGFIFPNASALTLAAFGHNAGNASALMGAFQMGIGATASAAVSFLQNNTTLPMTSVMAFCSITALSIFMLGRKITVKEPTSKEVEGEDVEMISGL
ncbi:MAG TPA: multidrug effflux MFS transporter [Cyclobacteriaceae bacterium]|jgi:DHA1 family bicyclomycin/chloramphenicol resistance-like MFS transporter|nr:multidrug effflux MFS transporter [Cyclobacteriaceae bacterium]